MPQKLALVITPKAFADLKKIYFYTAEKFGVEQAEHYQDQIDAQILALQTGLRRGKRYLTGTKEIYRVKMQKHYIFYQLKTKHLEIIRVLHQAMDLPQHLN